MKVGSKRKERVRERQLVLTTTQGKMDRPVLMTHATCTHPYTHTRTRMHIHARTHKLVDSLTRSRMRSIVLARVRFIELGKFFDRWSDPALGLRSF